MQVATTGLVLRQVKVGEADRILTILTPDLGVVSASARGSLRMKSALFSATGLFCYSEFTLTSGRSHYFVDTAQVKKVFHGISASIEGMALASYMAEIAAELSPAPPEADAQLRLLLNCLYMISERHYPCAQLKAIYELRALTLAGYMPDVLACAGCGKYDGGEFYLDPVEGRLLCADCAEKAHHITNLDNGALYALRKADPARFAEEAARLAEIKNEDLSHDAPPCGAKVPVGRRGDGRPAQGGKTFLCRLRADPCA